MAESGGRGGARVYARAAGYALAAGLLVLSGVLLYQTYAPDIRFWFGQQQLSGQVPIEPVEPSSSATSTAATATLDFTGWSTQDVPYWRSLKIGGAFARIVAPAAGIDAIVLKGVSQAQLALGPGWITRTDLPGATGNCGISGHRVTHGHPFRHLDRLRMGATIDLYSRFRRYRYVVDRILRVKPSEVSVIAHTPEPRLTLTTCDPPGSAQRRLVIQAHLVEVRLLEPGAGS